MTRLQSHRGPDDFQLAAVSFRRKEARLVTEGLATTGECDAGLGFNRLSIIDLTETGRQPMISPDGLVVLVFNGEIYNAFDYVRELEAMGWRFRGKSDTEILLAMYQIWGIDGVLARANGMFAFAIIDIGRGLVFLGRDHAGIKPLYVYRKDGLLLFASEMKSFLAHPEFRAELDPGLLDEYALFRSVAGRTLLKGVETVAPGTYWQVQDGSVAEKRYWRLPARGDCAGAGHQSGRQETAEQLRRAVKSQLISEVPLGCQLSGGVDSSIVSYYAAEQSPRHLKAFSVCFEDQQYSEDPWMRKATRVCGVDGNLFVLDAAYFVDNLEKAAWHMEEPMTHPSSLGILLLAERSSRFVTVLLSGEGADELFAGYTRHLDALLRESLGCLVPGLLAVPGLRQRLGPHLDHGGVDAVEDFILTTAVGDQKAVGRLFPGFDRERALGRRRALYDSEPGDEVSRRLRYEFRVYLEPLLVRQDKMTMASSMENRVPFLDREFVEFAWRVLPEHALLRRPSWDEWRLRKLNKIVIKELAAEIFGQDFAYRKKIGFGIPLFNFLKPRYEEPFRDALLPAIRSRGLLDASELDRLWTAWGQPGDESHISQELIWTAIALELSLASFLDSTDALTFPKT